MKGILLQVGLGTSEWDLLFAREDQTLVRHILSSTEMRSRRPFLQKSVAQKKTA